MITVLSGNNEFFKKVSSVFLGTLGAQLITVGVMLVLVRLYTPAEIGFFSVWLSSAIILAVVVTFRYELAFFSTSNIDETYSLGKLLTIIMLVVALVIYVLIFSFNHFNDLLPEVVKDFLIELVIVVFLLGSIKVLTSILVFQRKFKKLGLARVSIAASIAVAQVLAGLFSLRESGLIYGHLFGIIVGVSITFLFLESAWVKKSFSQPLSKLFESAKTFADFPKFSLPADLANTAANQLPLILIAMRFGAEIAGLYALTVRVMGAPIGLLATSVLDVFKEQAASDFRQYGDCRTIFLSTFKTLASLAILPFIILWYLSEWLFAFFFGADWIEAGHYVAIMIPLFYMRFVVSPLSYTIYIAQKQKFDLLWQLSLLTMVFSVFSFAPTIEVALIWFSWGYSFMYFIYFWLAYSCAKGNKVRLE